MAEAVFLMKAANGMRVRVPESKLESWQKAQDEIRAGQYKASEQEIEQIASFGSTRAKGGSL